MNINGFTRRSAGRLLKIGQQQWAFMPSPLPPVLGIDWELADVVSAADRAVGELAGIGHTLPNPHLLMGPYSKREAVLSSRIEGTQATLPDLFSAEAGARVPEESDVREVLNYILALEFGLRRLAKLPVSLRLLREIHAQLMKGVRGHKFTPGEFRRAQNFIGPPGCKLEDATYVPPPVPQMREALGQLEKYVHAEPRGLPPLVRLALVHYQFEAIHPFWDGNGRIGRLLVSLLLCSEGLLPHPLLYLSAYFERNRRDYYRLLLDVSQDGDWSAWLRFFLTGVAEEARDAVARAHQLFGLRREYREKLLARRSSARALELMETLFQTPVVTIASARQRLRVTARAAQQNVDKLIEEGILEEVTGQRRNRVFSAERIIAVIEADRAIPEAA